MTKRDKEQLDRINATYDAIFNEIGDLPIEDVRRALAEAGVNREQLRVGLNMRATELARQLRSSNQAAPPALTHLLEQTSDPTQLPADPKRALDKAKQYMANLFGPPSAAGSAAIVGAFRGEGDLTDRDQKTIEDIDAELLERAKAEDEPSES